VHTFPNPGSYQVTLVVTDNGGATDGSTAGVSVSAPKNKKPHAEFAVACPNPDRTCTFTDQSGDEDGSIASWHWDFGDGQSFDGQSPPPHTYAAAGEYHVTLTVIDNGGAQDSKENDAHPTAPPPPQNGAPTAVPDQYTTNEGSNNTLTRDAASGVLANDTDPEHDPLTATLVSGPSNGTLNLGSDGSFNYTPNAEYFGDDAFTYQASDPSGGSSTATVTIHVQPVNDSPRFSDQGGVTVLQDGGLQTFPGWAFGISPGAPNEAGQVLTFKVVANDNPSLFASAPAITLDGIGSTGTLTFTPASGASGVANVVMVLQDNGGTANGGSDTSTPHPFLITVNAAGSP